MSAEIKEISQTEAIAAALQKILPNVSAQDKKDAAADLTISVFTISKYFSGEVRSIDTGMELLSYFKGKIAARNELLAAE